MLVCLRRCLHGHHLEKRFGVSDATVSRVWDTRIPLLHDRLSLPDIWPSTQHVQDTMPPEFRAFLGTRVIFDCTEKQVEIASNFRRQLVMYSSYNHKNIAKGLLGISPNGAVTLYRNCMQVGRVIKPL